MKALLTLFTFIIAILVMASVSLSARTLDFAGPQWQVRTGSGGPGPNSWSDSEQSVWVDASGKLHLDWGNVSGADKYQVQVDNNSNFSSPEKDAQPLSSYYNASGLADGTRYWWRVRAHNSCGWGNWNSGDQGFMTGLTQEEYQIDIGLTVDGVIDADTIRIDELSSFDFYYRNDDTLGGYSTGFRIWSDNGVEWAYDMAILRIDHVSFMPPEVDTIWAVVTTVDGSRQSPVNSVWDQYFDIHLEDTTGADGLDSILWAGTRKYHGLYPGPLERQVLVHFHATAGAGGTLCIDSNKVGLAGDFIFIDIAGGCITPEALWPEGGRCWPVAGPTTAADGGTPGVPFTCSLRQNYPNPFNPVTSIEFDLPKSAFVTLTIYDILGKKVRTLIYEYLAAGRKVVTWDGRDDNGQLASSGIYFYRLVTDDFTESKKMILLK